MKKSFAMLMLLVILFNVTSPLMVSAADTKAPKPPEPVEGATVSPPISLEPSQATPAPPSPHDYGPEREEALARAAMEETLNKYLDYWGPRYQVKVSEVKVEDVWAHGVAEWQSEVRLVEEPLYLLARRAEDGTWQALMPSEEGLYLQWGAIVPEDLLEIDRNLLRLHATEVYSAVSLIQPTTNVRSALTPTLQSELERAFEVVLDSYIHHLEPGETFEPEEVQRSGPWAYMIAQAVDEGGQVVPYKFVVLLGHYSELKGWYIVAPEVNTNEEYNDLLDRMPEPLMNESTRAYLRRVGSRVRLLGNFSGHKLPWPAGQIGYVTKRDGTDHENQVDFDILGGGSSGDVYASRPGTVVFVKESSNTGCCSFSCWEQANLVVVQHSSSEYSWYVHLAYNSVPVSVGQSVGFGTKVGVEDGTGYSCGTHLHYMGSTGHTSWTDPSDPNSAPWGTGITAVDFDEVSWSGMTVGQYYTSQNEEGTPPPSGEAKLYGSTNYQDLVWSGGTGFSNEPNANSSSMEIPSGWSVITWKEDDRGGSERCWSESIPKLQDHGWLYAIQSIEVFDYNACSSSPSGEVKLYGSTNYQDLVWSGGTGFSNGPNADSSSMEVPSGWSVITWKEDDRGGSERCWSESIPKLQDHGWLYAIQSIEVFDHDVCLDPPGAPSLLNPSNGATFDEGEDIVLSWTDTGDQYYGEITNGPSPLSFGWQSGTSYNLGQQWPGYTYSWRVKARNGDGESGWSSSRSFNVRPGAPTNLSATAPTCGRVELGWTDTSGSEHGFVIYRNGSSIDTVAANVTSYTDDTVGESNSYSYYVKAYTGGVDSAQSNTVSVSTPACPTIGPLVYAGHSVDDDTTGQSSGDGDGIVECGESIELYVSLQNQGNTTASNVNASIAVNDSYISWLYNTSSDYYDIPAGETRTNSNDFDFEVAGDIPDGHTIRFYITASDASGNSWSDSFDIYVSCSVPDLEPYAPSGYQYPVVPASIGGTTHSDTLLAGNFPTYFDWHFINSGGGEAPGTFYVELWIDDQRHIRYPQGTFAPGQDGGFDDWMIDVEEAGWHTVRLIVDPDDTVEELDETNNTWEHDFYWIPSAPYSDDMESGAGEWNATGLWHQVDAGSSYPESHSGFNSWWYGQESTGDYDTGVGNSGNLDSPPVYIPDVGYYLRFWYRYETETQTQMWDWRKVQISVDDGPFESVLQLYDDPMNEWLQSPALDLSAYAGHTIRVRFHFNTQDALYNTYRGWYIDDFEISATPPPTCGDIYEPNDGYAEATSLSYGQSLNADICAGGDYDYYQFSGNQGDRVVVDIDAQTEGSLLDPYTYLLDDDGLTVLAESDDEVTGEVRDSLLGYQLPYTGTYYIKVKAWDHPSAGSPDHFYTLRLFTDHTPPSSLEITTPSSGSWLDPNMTSVNVSAVDDESGIHRVEFFWHDSDWGSSDWIWLGADQDGRDGWSWTFDSASQLEQQEGSFYAYAYDWANNYIGAGVGNLGIDHTPPTLYDISTVAPYGGAPFRDFEVRWNGWDALSGLDTYDVQYRVDENPTWNNLVLRTTDVYTDFVGDDGHTYYFRARARDNVGNLSLYSTEEVSHTVDICDISPDDYENDNTSGYASSLSPNGYAQIHNIHAEGDADWVKFTAQAGVTYTLTTGNLGQHADTVLELYDTDGSTLLAENDDCPDRWPSSCLEWQAPNAGTYYVKVYHWDPWAYGCTTEYGLSITSDQAPSLNLGEPGTAFRYLNTLGTTDVPYLTDEQHLNSPQGVAIDSNGNLYLTEVMGQRLLKYNSSGQLLWAFGQPGINAWDETHLAYPHGVALDETRDRVYVANSNAHVVMILDTEGNHIGTLGTLGESGSDNTHLNNPRGVTVAADGTTYVSDTGNHRVQIFDSAGNYQHTLGTGQGSGDYQFNEPDGLALGGGGRLYVADYQNHRVQVFTADRVYSTTLGITGEVGTDNTHFDHPNAIAVDDANNLYVVDNGNHRVQKFDPALTYLDTLGESGVSGADSAHFEAPTSLAIGSDGTLYVADGNNHRVQEFNGSGAYVGTRGTLGIPYLVDAQHLNHPSDVAVDANGNRFVIEYFGHRLLKFAPDGSFLTSVGTAGRMGTDNTHFGWPQGVAVADNGTVYVADTNNHRVQVFDNNLNYQATLGTGTCGGGEDKFCAPHKVTVDAEGRLYVADTWNHRVQVFDASYNLVGTLGLTWEADSDNLRFDAPRGIAVDNEGHIYVADELNNRVQQCVLVGSSGSCTTFIGETGVVGDDFARLRAPLDVAVDDLGRIYVNDSYWNQRIQVFDSDGAYLTTVGGLWGSEHGKFRNPNGIDVGPDGALFVADTDGNRVEEYALGVPGWAPTNLNGFGDRHTRGVSALAEFEDQLYAGASNWNAHAQLWRSTDGATWTEVTPSSLNSNAVVDLAIFDAHLYASTGWGGASQLWRSSDGSTWAAVVTDGFGDPNTESIANLTAFNGHLYAATHNDMDGFAIWRSSTGDPGSWLSVLINGHGNANLNIVTGLTEFEGHLYAAAENQVGGLEVWRTADGTNWERTAFDGFGDPNNTETGGIAAFEGRLYIGTRNDITGAQLWRSTDGTTWNSVMTNGFGNRENRKLESLSVAYDALYAVTYNDKSGAEVWRSEDGESWVISATHGWGDPNNYGSLWNNATVFFDEHLYIGTWNDAHGGELWRSDLQLAQADFVASLTSGVPPFTVQFVNQSSGDYDACEWNFGDGSTAIGCASQSHTYSDEGTFSVSLQISGSGGVDTEIKVDYIQVQDLYYVYLPLTLRSR